MGDSAWLHAEMVSKATCRCLGFTIEKFNFSKPITFPNLSFIRITSSPVSSQIYSSWGSPNQTVSVFPIPGPYSLSFLDRIGWICGDQKPVPIQPLGNCTNPTPRTFRLIKQIYGAIALALSYLAWVSKSLLHVVSAPGHDRVFDRDHHFPISARDAHVEPEWGQDFKQQFVRRWGIHHGLDVPHSVAMIASRRANYNHPYPRRPSVATADLAHAVPTAWPPGNRTRPSGASSHLTACLFLHSIHLRPAVGLTGGRSPCPSVGRLRCVRRHALRRNPIGTPNNMEAYAPASRHPP